MSWMQRAQSHFLEMPQDGTDKTAKTPLSSVSSVPPQRLLEKTQGVSSVSSVGVVALFENCIPAGELIAAAMRACDAHGDSPEAREQMRRDCLETPPHLRADLLQHLRAAYPASSRVKRHPNT